LNSKIRRKKNLCAPIERAAQFPDTGRMGQDGRMYISVKKPQDKKIQLAPSRNKSSAQDQTQPRKKDEEQKS
jgi:hypothetical protein